MPLPFTVSGGDGRLHLFLDYMATPSQLPQATAYARAPKGMRRVNWSDTYHTEESVRALAAAAGVEITSVEEAPAGKCFYDASQKAWRVRVRYVDARGKRVALVGQTRTSVPLWELVYTTVRASYRAAHRSQEYACCKCGAKHFSAKNNAYIIPLFRHYADGVCFECGGAGYFVPALYAPTAVVVASRSQDSKEETRRRELRAQLLAA